MKNSSININDRFSKNEYSIKIYCLVNTSFYSAKMKVQNLLDVFIAGLINTQNVVDNIQTLHVVHSV